MFSPVVTAVAFAADVLDEVDELFIRVVGATRVDVAWRIAVMVPAPFAEVPLTGPFVVTVVTVITNVDANAVLDGADDFTVVVDAIERGSLAAGPRVAGGSFEIESFDVVGESSVDAPGAAAPTGVDGSDSSGPPEGRVSSSRASAFGWPKSSRSPGGSTTSTSGRTGSSDGTATAGAVAIGAEAGTTTTACLVALAAAATRSVCAIAPMSAKVAAVAVAPVRIRLAYAT